MKYTISVTEEIIKKGKRGGKCVCPLALAARKVFPHAGNVMVAVGRVNGVVDWHLFVDQLKGQPDIVYRMSPPMIQFAMTFDRGEKVHPTDFDIEV